MVKNEMNPAQRLIIAADFKPSIPGSQGEAWVYDQVNRLAYALEGTGVCIKVNSAARAFGHSLIEILHERGFAVFADYKLYDTDDTVKADGLLLQSVHPEILTIPSDTGPKSMKALLDNSPGSTVLGITILSHLTQAEVTALHYYPTIEEAVLSRAAMIQEVGLHGLVCAPKEVSFVREQFPELLIVAAGVRFADSEVKGENQNLARVLTPGESIRAGAWKIVMGKPIIQANDPRSAVLRAIDEIAAAA